MKKIFTLIFLSVFCLNAINAAVTWKLYDDGILTISGTSMPDYSEKDIPWRSQRDKIKKVIIEKGVTKIGKCAFIDCSALTSVTIPNSVTSIGAYAFYGCSCLASITIPNSVTSIGIRTFESCSSLASIIIPNSVTDIGNYSFYNCSNLVSITIPNSVTSIGRDAFYGCNNLKKICNSSSLILSKGSGPYGPISANFIYNKANVEGNYILYQDDNANCYVCGYIGTDKNISLPIDIVGIADYAFEGCSGLVSVAIPNTVTSIGSFAFSGCSGLASITIPNSVTSIGENAFAKCENLSELVYNAENATLSASAPNLSFPASIKTVTIGNKVESIPSYFLYNNKNISSITIPNSVKGIGIVAFMGCTNLKKIFNNSSLVLSKKSSDNGYIAYYANAIYNNVSIDGYYRICKDNNDNNWVCDYLGSDKNITLPKNVYGIAEYAFFGCSDLTSITIPLGVSSIGNKVFDGCDNLVTLKYNAQKATLSESFPTSIKTISIGSEVESIPTSFISGNKNITSITLPNSVTSIGNSAFKGCSGLTSVTIPNSVTSIGYNAFYGCI